MVSSPALAQAEAALEASLAALPNLTDLERRALAELGRDPHGLQVSGAASLIASALQCSHPEAQACLVGLQALDLVTSETGQDGLRLVANFSKIGLARSTVETLANRPLPYHLLGNPHSAEAMLSLERLL